MNIRKTKAYRSWKAMRMRCLNKNDISYKRYGARGIKFCKRWENFEHFFADMGERPIGTSLERINNDKGYSPSNCRWATKTEQANNRRSNHLITFQGVTKNITAWAKTIGVDRNTLSMRFKYGWSIEKILTTK